MAAEAVKVIVRCRPMNARETSLKASEVVKIDSQICQCSLMNIHEKKAKPKMFTFDGAYDKNSTTEQIYEDIGYPLVEGVTEGYNGTIFAYGQTGCGKSFSMQGLKTPISQRGIIPRAFDHIFETIQVSEGIKYLVHASYLEIYNEDVRDLLGHDVKAKLELKEHPDKGVYVQGLSMHPCKNVGDCEEVMKRGWHNRATGSTLMNAESSRSHSIFTIHLERCDKDGKGEEHIRAAKLNLVDLAGSERQAKTGSTGERLREATKINLSLSALGNVISALVDGRARHVPYRDSKLTRLLQDSLGGNTKTLMVACLSPADDNYDETLSTLRYANRAKNIRNKPKINEDPKDALLREYQDEIRKLQAMLRGEIPVELAGGVLAPTAAQKSKAPVKTVEEVVVHVGSSEEITQEKVRLRQEYESQILKMKRDFEEMKMSKERLQAEMSRLQQNYDSDIATVDKVAKKVGNKEASQVISTKENPVAIPIQVCERVVPKRLARAPQRYARSTPRKAVKKKEAPAVISANENAVPIPIEKCVRIESTKEVDMPASTPRQEDMQVVSVSSMGDSNNTADEVLEDDDVVMETHPQPPVQHALHLGTTSNCEDNGTTRGGVAPRSSPTGENIDLQTANHNEALRSDSPVPSKGAVLRLKELEQRVVGGEQANNEEVKERRRKKKKHVEERKRKLADALARMDGEDIMLDIYDNVQEELKVKAKLLEKERELTSAQSQEIRDLQAEFACDRDDYLDTIRKQERQLLWLRAVIDRLQPCLRRGSNYADLERVRMQSVWDDDTSTWQLPRVVVERTVLPPAAETNGVKSDSNQKPQMNGDNEDLQEDFKTEDRYLQRLHGSSEQELASNYFRSRRADKLLHENRTDDRNWNVRPTLSPKNNHPSNGISPTTNGTSSWQGRSMSPDQLRAAEVHGQMSAEELPMRKPARLESLLQPTTGRTRRKKNKLEPL